jgi:hypothetical protein
MSIYVYVLSEVGVGETRKFLRLHVTLILGMDGDVIKM